jgi:prepilin-type N-terminal cleavage/methylation domain-containing protein
MIFNTFIGKRGFTLLEVVIALATASIIFAVLFGSIRTLLFSTEVIKNRNPSPKAAQICLSRIVQDLRTIYIQHPPLFTLPSAREGAPDPYRIAGDQINVAGTQFPRLRFTSTSHLMMGEASRRGVAEIVYYVQQFDEDGFALHRSDTLYPYPESIEPKRTDPILCAPLQSFTLTYFDGEGDTYSQWDSESEDLGFASPRAIEITMALGQDKSTAEVFQTRVQLPMWRAEKK